MSVSGTHQCIEVTVDVLRELRSFGTAGTQMWMSIIPQCCFPLYTLVFKEYLLDYKVVLYPG